MYLGPILAASLLASALNTPSDHSHLNAAADAYHAVSVNHTIPKAELPGMPAVGQIAPDFTYQSSDMLWQNLHDMLEQGSVLLVFGAGDDQLRQIEHERENLLHQGVVPVAVVDHRDHDVWATVRRLNLNYSLLADPHCVLAEQYGVLDAAARHTHTAWFGVDRSGHVRGSGRGESPSRGWTTLTADVLGLPNANALRSVSAH